MINKIIITVGIFALVIGMSDSLAYGQDASTMSPEEYEASLSKWKDRESSANSELSRLDREIASLRKQLGNVEGNIEKERDAIFGLMSASDEEIQNYMKLLSDLDDDVSGLEEMSEEELLAATDHLEDIELRMEKMNENDFSAFDQNRDMLDDIEAMLSNYRTVIPEPAQDPDDLASADSTFSDETDSSVVSDQVDDSVIDDEDLAEISEDDQEQQDSTALTSIEDDPQEGQLSDGQEMQPDAELTDGETPRNVTLRRTADSYKVIRGDNLWNISKKEEIYNDPFQWLKIYSANREQIANPHIIEIDQVFVIPREPAINEHWVSKGENLSTIAAEKYSNPFEWTRIYQANKTILESPDLVLPHTILIIPKIDKKKDTTPVNM